MNLKEDLSTIREHWVFEGRRNRRRGRGRWNQKQGKEEVFSHLVILYNTPADMHYG